MHAIQGTKVFLKLGKSVILDKNQDHYHLITLLYLNINSNRAVCCWKLIKENQKKEIGLTQAFSVESILAYWWTSFSDGANWETTITSKEQNNYVKEIVSMAQAAYWLTLCTQHSEQTCVVIVPSKTSLCWQLKTNDPCWPSSLFSQSLIVGSLLSGHSQENLTWLSKKKTRRGKFLMYWR